MLPAERRPDDLDDEMASVMAAFDPLELEGLILLWADANYACRAWGEGQINGQAEAGLIKGHVTELVLRAGAKGETLDLSRLRISQASPARRRRKSLIQ